MVYLALTYDHRLVDGADAARFLTAIKQRLEEANFESELGALTVDAESCSPGASGLPRYGAAAAPRRRRAQRPVGW